MRRPEQAQSELLEPPSVAERRLRARLGELVAAQAVEDEAGRSGLRGGIAGAGLYHRYNAALKRISGGKSRAQMDAVRIGGGDRLAGAETASPITCICWTTTRATPGRRESAASGGRR